ALGPLSSAVLAEDDLLGDQPRAARGLEIAVLELRGGRVLAVDQQGERTEVVAAGGEHLPFPALPQEQPAPQLPGQRPGTAELLRLVRGEQAGLDRGLELGEGRGGAQRLDLVAVIEGEQLGAPLDIGHPSAAELQMPRGIGVARQTLGLHTGLHPGDRPAGGVVEAADGIAVPVHLLDEPRADGLRGDDRPGTQQGLLLPGLGVPAEVVDPGVEGAGERTHLPSGRRSALTFMSERAVGALRIFWIWVATALVISTVALPAPRSTAMNWTSASEA